MPELFDLLQNGFGQVGHFPLLLAFFFGTFISGDVNCMLAGAVVAAC